MNWKKEGYTVGDKVVVVVRRFYSNSENVREATIKHAGTKILKVELGKMIIKFENGKVTNSKSSFGVSYVVYKSKEEYKNSIKTAEERKRLRKKAMDCVPKLSNEQLEQIIKWVERG